MALRFRLEIRQHYTLTQCALQRAYYQGRDVDPQTVAKDLKVEGIVTGRIVQRGDQLIIAAELIDARTNRSLWGDQYNRKLSDVLTAQEDITRAISSKLRARLSRETKNRVAKVRGIWATAEREYTCALKLNPNYANAHKLYSLYLDTLARHQEALSEIKRAVELDPLNLKYNDNLGQEYDAGLQYATAVEQFKKVIEMDPSFASAHANLGSTYFQMGRHELWLDEWKKAAALSNDKEEAAIADEVSQVYSRSGFHAASAKSVELYRQLAKHRYVDPGNIGYQYAHCGTRIKRSPGWRRRMRKRLGASRI